MLNNRDEKYALIFMSVVTISTVLVGMSLFDKNGKLGNIVYIAGIIGYVTIATTVVIILLGVLITATDEKQSKKLKQTIGIKLTELNIFCELEDWDHAHSTLEELIYITSKSPEWGSLHKKLKLLDKIFSNLQKQDYMLLVAADLNYKDIECCMRYVEKIINITPESEQEIYLSLQKLYCTYGELKWPSNPLLLNTKCLLYSQLLLEDLATTLKSQKPVDPKLQELDNIFCRLQEQNQILCTKSFHRDNYSNIGSIMSRITMQEGLNVSMGANHSPC